MQYPLMFWCIMPILTSCDLDILGQHVWDMWHRVRSCETCILQSLVTIECLCWVSTQIWTNNCKEHQCKVQANEIANKHVIIHEYLILVWSAYYPRPYWQFSDTTLRTRQSIQNMLWTVNCLVYLHLCDITPFSIAELVRVGLTCSKMLSFEVSLSSRLLIAKSTHALTLTL